MIVPILLGVSLLLFFLLAWFHHWRAIILVSALLPTYLWRFTVAGVPTTYLEATIGLVLLTGVLNPATRRAWPAAWRGLPRVARAAGLTFLAAAAIGVMVADFTQSSLGIFKGWIVAPMLYGWLVATVPTARRAAFLPLLVGSGVVIALHGLTQLNDLPRVRGPFDVPNSLALFLTPLAVASTFSALSHHFVRWRYVASSLILWAAILATQSAAAPMVGVLAILIAGWIGAPAGQRRLALAAGTLALASLLVLGVSGRLQYLISPLIHSDTQNSLTVRRQLWSIGAELVRDHPLLGIGLGQFEPAYQQKLHERFTAAEAARQGGGHSLALPVSEFVFRDPHNWLLSFWLNTGLLGLVSFTALNFSALRHSLRNHQPDSLYSSLAAALVALLLYGLVDSIYWKNDLAVLHWLLLAVCLTGFFSMRGAQARNYLSCT